MIQSKPVETIQKYQKPLVMDFWVYGKETSAYRLVAPPGGKKRGVYKQLPENARNKCFCHSIKNGSTKETISSLCYF